MIKMLLVLPDEEANAKALLCLTLLRISGD